MQVILTDDGSSTIVSEHFDGQLYHSSRGASGESHHVYTRFLEDGDSVLEVGFGSGLNALQSLQSGLKGDYTTVELYPIDEQTVEQLSFCCDDLRRLHQAPWGDWVPITDNFRIRKLNIDVTQTTKIPVDGYSIVFFDAFAPDVVPEQWSEKVFAAIYDAMTPGGRLVTYSAKGVVKRTLREVGFEVKRLQGALGKHNMLMATKR